MKVTHQGVREVLATVGPLTSREIAEFFPDSRPENVGAVINTMRTLATKQVHICGWTRDNGHGKTYLRAIYALGDRRDSLKPAPFSNAERCERKRAKARRPKINSVWALGAHA